MKETRRAALWKDNSRRESLTRLCFKEEIEENNIFLAASLAYFFGVFFACLTREVEMYFGTILILTAIMIVWYFMSKRKEIRREYERRIDALFRDNSWCETGGD